MDGDIDEPRNLTEYRIKELQGWRAEQEKWRREVDADRRDFVNAIEDVRMLSNAVNGLRRTILAFALSIAGSATVFALTVLAATGKI